MAGASNQTSSLRSSLTSHSPTVRPSRHAFFWIMVQSPLVFHMLQFLLPPFPLCLFGRLLYVVSPVASSYAIYICCLLNKLVNGLINLGTYTYFYARDRNPLQTIYTYMYMIFVYHKGAGQRYPTHLTNNPNNPCFWNTYFLYSRDANIMTTPILC